VAARAGCLLLSMLAVAAVAGCGASEGVSAGAVVTVYAKPSLCGGAQRRLEEAGGRAGGLRVRVTCLGGDAGAGSRLASIGAGARRTVQDSTAIAYLEPPGAEVDYSRPILDEAEIRVLVDGSGGRAMDTVLRALEARGGGESPREAVWNG
jgi:hypothetical protein